jgi:hypothetical protein
LLLLVVVVLACATGHQVAFALGVLEVGALPGEGPPGYGVALLSGTLSLTVGAALAAGYALSSRQPGTPAAFLAPLAAGFVTARFYTFDPYCAPSHCRFSDGGIVPEAWIVVLIALAALGGILTLRLSSSGMGLTSVVMLLSMLLAMFVGIGH